MKDIVKLGVILFAICAVAALVLGVTDNSMLIIAFNYKRDITY